MPAAYTIHRNKRSYDLAPQISQKVEKTYAMGRRCTEYSKQKKLQNFWAKLNTFSTTVFKL